VTVLVSRSQAAPVLDAIEQTRTVAVVFSEPRSHKTIQIKSTDAVRGRTYATDRELLKRYTEAFVTDVCPLGYAEPGIRALLSCDPADIAAIRFTPQSAFLQTPGPHAGEPLGDSL